MKYIFSLIKMTKGYILYSFLSFFTFILLNNFFLNTRIAVTLKSLSSLHFYLFGLFCDWTPKIIPHFIYSFLTFLLIKLIFIFFAIKYLGKRNKHINNFIGIYYSFDILGSIIIIFNTFTFYQPEFYFFSSAPTFNFSKTIGIHCSITFLLMYILSLATHSFLAKITTRQLLSWFFISLISFFISIIGFYILNFIVFK